MNSKLIYVCFVILHILHNEKFWTYGLSPKKTCGCQNKDFISMFLNKNYKKLKTKIKNLARWNDRGFYKEHLKKIQFH